MALSRCIETRLLEAVWTETKNCFTDSVRVAAGDSAISLDSTYSHGGQYRIYGRPFMKTESIVPYQINIVPLPPTWEPGTSGRSTTLYSVEVDFIFPFDFLNIAAGQNTFLDHIAVYRAWMAAGGSWRPNKGRALKDPDNPTKEIAHLVQFAQEAWEPAPQDAGALVPVLLKYETRESGAGAIT